MFKLLSAINSGVDVDVEELKQRQRECWLRVCWLSNQLVQEYDAEDFILCRNGALRYISDRYPEMIKFMSDVSGSVTASYRVLNFARGMCGLERKTDLGYLMYLMNNLEMFDCYQQILKRVTGKKGAWKFSPRLLSEPKVYSRVYDGDLEILAECLSRSLDTVSIGKYLVKKLREEVGLAEDEPIVKLKTLSIEEREVFECEFIDLILGYADKDTKAEFINDKIVSHCESVINSSIRTGSVGFFYLYGESFFLENYDNAVDELYDVLSDEDKQNAVVASPTYLFVKHKNGTYGERQPLLYKDLHYVSPICIVDGDRASSFTINLGYLGEYYTKSYMLKHGLVSDYNPVLFIRPEVTPKAVNLVSYEVYYSGWVRPKDVTAITASVLEEDSLPVLSMPFTTQDLSRQYECSNLDSLVESTTKIVLGNQSYVDLVRSHLKSALTALVDNKSDKVSLSPLTINFLTAEEVESFADTDELLHMILD